MRISIISLLFLAACPDARADSRLEVWSTAFKDGGAIPTVYTCDGASLSPPLSWANVPKTTRSVALLVDDPDAPKGTFTHWLVTGISPMTRQLDAGAALPEGAVAAKNDKGQPGYAGPCPPSGRHHYHFQVYALDTTLRPGMSRSDFLAAIKGHVTAQGELIGTYEHGQ